MKLSVVIVSFNSATTLRACLGSLRGQRTDMEVIVVDNASTDDSLAAAREFAEAVVLAQRDNVGYAAANNAGIRAATGEFVLLLNPDCEVRPGALQALLDFADSHPDAGAIGAKLLNPDGTLQPSGRAFPTLGRWWLETTGLYRLRTDNANLDPQRDYDQSGEVDEVSGACMLLRRAALAQVDLLDERFFLLWEDIDLCKRLRAAGWKVWYCAEAQVVHHFGVSRKPVSELVRRVSMQSAERYFRKHHGTFAYAFVKSTHVAKEAARKLSRKDRE